MVDACFQASRGTEHLDQLVVRAIAIYRQWMTGVGVSWSAPAWVGQSDKDYSDLIRKKAEAVTRRDKRRGGKYSIKEAIEAIHQAFHRCNGFDPTTAPSWIQTCWAPTAMSEAKRVLPTSGDGDAATIDHVTAEPVPDFEIVSWQTNDAKGDMPPEEFIAYCRRVVEVAKHH